MKSKIFREISAVALIVIFIAAQCRAQQGSQIQETVDPLLLTPTFEDATSIVLPPTSTPSTPPDKTEIDLPDFNNLGSGQYILVQTSVDSNKYLFLLSTDKTVVRKFLSDATVGVSNDGKQLLIMRPGPNHSYMFDFVIGKWTELVIDRDCLNASWLSGEQYIALSCINDATGEIYILNTRSDSLIQITDCLEKEESCIDPSWSLDGRWLAYYRYDQGSGVHPRGVHVFDTACIESNNCMNKEIGPIESDSNAVWSVKSELILSNHGQILFLKNDNREFIQTKKIDSGTDYLNYLEYSPDGEYLLYTSHHDTILNLYSLSSDASEGIFNSNNPIRVIGWIVIK